MSLFKRFLNSLFGMVSLVILLFGISYTVFVLADYDISRFRVNYSHSYMRNLFGVASDSKTDDIIEELENVRVLMLIEREPVFRGNVQMVFGEGVLVITDKETRFQKGEVIRVAGKSSRRQKALFGEELVLRYPEIEKSNQGARNESFLDKTVSLILRVQGKFSRVLQAGLPEPHGSLLVGILLGLRRSFDQNFYDLLVTTGTLHVIAASGYNISVVSRLIVRVFGYFFSRKKAVVSSLVGIAGYALLAGASPAVVRAAVMGSIAFISQLYGREYIASWGLALASIAMVIVSPGLVGDIGFWLSVSATAGILWSLSEIERLLEIIGEKAKILLGVSRGREPELVQKRRLSGESLIELVVRALKVDLSVTLAAYIFTLPLLVMVFGQISLVGPIVNTLILWLIPILMFLGGVKLLIGLVWLPFTFVLAWFVWVPLEIFILIVEFFGQFGWAGLDTPDLSLKEGGFLIWIGAACYYMLLVLYLFRLRKR